MTYTVFWLKSNNKGRQTFNQFYKLLSLIIAFTVNKPIKTPPLSKLCKYFQISFQIRFHFWSTDCKNCAHFCQQFPQVFNINFFFKQIVSNNLEDKTPKISTKRLEKLNFKILLFIFQINLLFFYLCLLYRTYNRFHNHGR